MDKPKFAINDEVFYRHRGKDREGEGIQCRVTDVVGEGKLRRLIGLATKELDLRICSRHLDM